MSYTKQNWKDHPDTSTPITADRLNHIENGIYDVDTDLTNYKNTVTNDLNKAKSDLNTNISSAKTELTKNLNEYKTEVTHNTEDITNRLARLEKEKTNIYKTISDKSMIKEYIADSLSPVNEEFYNVFGFMTGASAASSFYTLVDNGKNISFANGFIALAPLGGAADTAIRKMITEEKIFSSITFSLSTDVAHTLFRLPLPEGSILKDEVEYVFRKITNSDPIHVVTSGYPLGFQAICDITDDIIAIITISYQNGTYNGFTFSTYDKVNKVFRTSQDISFATNNYVTFVTLGIADFISEDGGNKNISIKDILTPPSSESGNFGLKATVREDGSFYFYWDKEE